MFARIREVRKVLGLNQKEFARQIGLTQTSLSMIEVGKTTLTEKNIKLICAVFCIDETWLRSGKGKMFGLSSPHEKELITIFNKLALETQDFLMELARGLLKKQQKEK